MHHTDYGDLASAGESPHLLGPREVNALIEVTREATRQSSPSRTIDPRSIEKRSDTPGETFGTQVEGMMGGSNDGGFQNDSSMSWEGTVSRGTQTDLDMAKPMHATETIHMGPPEQENTAPNRVDPPPLPQQPWHDPFISAMFLEPTAPVYDPAEQARRGMRGIVSPPARRGRVARTQQGAAGQLVHPAVVDATVFEEYVHQLIAELDRAP
ncbi:hypothetical protein BJX63DRAFT_382930 [Aspergillus granulosus]|uniref:Uncharacterized protein n=1 Tax=Aspergillus granulosus TaxID=176169 RepID=A0ABR4HTN1_9EURO